MMMDPTPEEYTNMMLRRAESGKTKSFPKPGMETNFIDCIPNNCKEKCRISAQMDEDYLVVGGHVDETTKGKIIKGEYIDFSKLIPRDKVMIEEESRMELVVKDGKAYWAPPTGDAVSINNFNKWEQAFRIFANIYTNEFPGKSTELIQYNYVIHTISLAYTWENVYAYDKEFRLHMSKHPGRSWSVILQQAWSMKLRDRLYKSADYPQGNGIKANYSNNGNSNGRRSGSGEPCRRYNRGKCKFGATCKYEHRCSYCNKFGHGFFNCRKASADRERNVGKKDRHGAETK